ncbi:MAG TPA: sugar phosphate nucleotidyltransferase [Gemmatimonadota bacterium]|nr:sugar phosphate nucleotidyltransferase [Gemmatimonadota bacterium]
MNYAVILAGGVGERFWPASTPDRPKQLLPLLSDRTMLRETADRLEGLVPPARRFVLTNRSLVDAVARECPEIPRANVIGEPEGRNTAPAIGLAAGLLQARDTEAALLVLPADHAIGDDRAFRASAESAFRLAAEDEMLVLFGVVPTRPETGYGYIERDSPAGNGGHKAYAVARFIEKPDAATAGRLWRDGRHYWNSGLFCGRASVFLAEYEKHLPRMRRAIDAAVAGWETDPEGALSRFYGEVETISIDYGILQRTDRAAVLPAAEWGWDDVGSWEALARWIEASPAGNVAVGDCALEACRDVIAFSQAGRIAALGISNCVIVRTAGETLVVARDALDDLKAFVRAVSGSAEGT